MKFRKMIAILAFTFLPTSIASAEILEIETSGEYTMGKNETPLVAERFAREDAYRLALMQAGVYIESRSEMVDHIITKDEVRAVAATILKVPEGNETYEHEVVGNGGMKVKCKILAIIDTEAVDLAAIAGDKRNLEVRTGMMNEVDQLQRENLELKEKLSKSESDSELQKQFIENQKKFLIRSYEQLLYNMSSKDLNLETIDKLRELDPDGYSADYFFYLYYHERGDDQKAQDSLKQGIRTIKRIYSPEQIRKMITSIIIDYMFIPFKIDVDEFDAFVVWNTCFDYSKFYGEFYISNRIVTDGSITNDEIRKFLEKNGVNTKELDWDISKFNGVNDIRFLKALIEDV